MFQFVGLVIVASSLVIFFIAGSPLVATWLGGAVAGHLNYVASNIYWIIPLGFALIFYRFLLTPPAAIPLVVALFISMIILFFLTGGTLW